MVVSLGYLPKTSSFDRYPPVVSSRGTPTGDRLAHRLRERHQAIQAGRLELGPGEWMTEVNSVGGFPFVEPTLVEGTLRKGLDPCSGTLNHPLPTFPRRL